VGPSSNATAAAASALSAAAARTAGKGLRETPWEGHTVGLARARCDKHEHARGPHAPVAGTAEAKAAADIALRSKK
tara:strand:- start:4573 stop:4800 length:228 start_codon:yes stop_codon:yes gene_type:complete